MPTAAECGAESNHHPDGNLPTISVSFDYACCVMGPSINLKSAAQCPLRSACVEFVLVVLSSPIRGSRDVVPVKAIYY